MKDIFLLDMDDTLFDFRRTEQINLRDTLALFGIPADAEVWKSFHEINALLWQEFERGEITKPQIKLKRFERLFAKYGYSADIAAVSEKYVNNFNEICIPFDGAREFLSALSELGRIYAVTNGNTDCQKRHIADAGFLPLFDGMFISDEIGFAKPSKQFAEYVKTHIPGFECRRAVWVGDSLTSDKACAVVAGVDFILYAPNGVPCGYTGVSAKDYNQLLKLIK